MAEPFLILHKVRGEPAFDIAIQMEVEDEVLWIIPTSGHRAYPARTWELSELADVSDINAQNQHNRPYYMDNLPEGLRDHYQCELEPKQTLAEIGQSLLSRLGMVKPLRVERRR